MLKKLLSTAVAAALLVSAATIALEALGVFFQARSDDDAERRIMEAFIARIEARFDPASPVEPTSPVDLPDTDETERLRWTIGRRAAPLAALDKAVTAAAVARPASQSERRKETWKATTAARAKAAPTPAAGASPASEAAERKPVPVVSRKSALVPATQRAAAAPLVAPDAAREAKEPVQVQEVPKAPDKADAVAAVRGPPPQSEQQGRAEPPAAAAGNATPAPAAAGVSPASETAGDPKPSPAASPKPATALAAQRVAAAPASTVQRSRPATRARRAPPRSAGPFDCPILGWLR